MYYVYEEACLSCVTDQIKVRHARHRLSNNLFKLQVSHI